ncbi:MAG TPA: pitrilysin family protein [Gemmatimonadaceae bacterium]|nr:pitrilysin family protein [Gemmatimonadaceae bacterium]
MTTSTRPQPGPAREYHFPSFERRLLSNGLTLLVAPAHSLPVVTVLAIVDAGAVAEPSGQEGVAHLAALALNEGTPKYDGEALTEYLERLGTSVGGSAGWDSASLAMTVLRDNLENAFVHFAEVLVAPTFPAAAIERLKGERIAELMQIESEPRELADEKFDEYIYDARSRFRLPLGGSRQSVSNLARAEVAAFHASRYQPSATTLIVVGDVNVAEVERMVSGELDGWNGSIVLSSKANDKPVRTSRAVRIVRKEDAPQSEVRIGHVGVPRTHPDYFSITVMNAVLGGLFSSRINLNLREAHGYTYGASSSFDWRREAGPFVIGTAVASDVTVPAIQETLKEIDRMRAEPISESELSLATSYLEGVFPIRYETTAAIAAALATLVIYDLPSDWYDSYRARMGAVTVKDVLAAARAYVHPDSLQIVIVGDAGAVREPLEALAFGPVDVVNP